MKSSPTSINWAIEHRPLQTEAPERPQRGYLIPGVTAKFSPFTSLKHEVSMYLLLFQCPICYHIHFFSAGETQLPGSLPLVDIFVYLYLVSFAWEAMGCHMLSD